MSTLRIVFRTDANQQIGSGHFMRCLALADELMRSQADISFVSRGLPLHFQQMLRDRGVHYKALPETENLQETDELTHAAWLTTSQAKDAEQTMAALGKGAWDWLVVDHYALDHRFEMPLRKICQHIMAIDDLADRVHDCDVLLDQNFYQDQSKRYLDKVPSHSRQLLGPSYALLRSEFKAMRDKVQVRTGKVNNILVYFGGVDAENLTGQVLDVLIKLNLSIQVTVVIGQQHPQKEKIQQLCAQHRFVCHVQTAQMASIMAEADLAIGAGGSSHWERCCLGLPSIVVATAVNQIPITDALSKLGGCLFLGEIQNTTLKKIKESLIFFLESSVECEKYSKSAFKLVDGNGVVRVSQELQNRMKIDILVSDPNHPIVSYLKKWKSSQEKKVNIVHSSKDLTGGYILFLISCAEILHSEITKKYKHSLVLHASDLPKGRGWSPHIWSVLEGNNLLTLSLLEAHEKVDQGPIWLKEHIALEGHELFDEINDKLFQAEIKLMTEAIEKANVIIPKSQAVLTSNYYPKRTPDDSRLNVHQNLIDQFNLLRISDKDRYPAFFEYLGHKYIVKIEKADHAS